MVEIDRGAPIEGVEPAEVEEPELDYPSSVPRTRVLARYPELGS